ncbi:RND family efflux transporter MFP subunit [Candidatus Magnetomorum sp. HK-1]|nr:RND family efflux transporter MFP subunit [Candidatus Magnetomorum sp. HK-1]
MKVICTKKIIIHLIWMLFFYINILSAQQPPAKVVVSKILEKELSKTCEIVGVVDFDKISGVSSEISGLITNQYVVEGTVVKQGNIMIRLNTDFLSKNIDIAKNQKEQIEINISNTKKNLERYETLFQNDAASEKTYEDLSYKYKELLKKKAEIQLSIDKLNLELKKSAIKAPFKGLVLKNLKNRGEWVSPGMAICVFASIEDIFVNVSVPEELIKYIKPGDKIYLKINSLNKNMIGVVKNYVPVADIKSKTIQVKIGIKWFSEAIQNMSATVNVPMSHKMKLKMIKRDALIRFNGKEYIYTVKEGKAELMPVNVVSYEGKYIGIDNSDILIDMPVITEGNDRLKPNQTVEIIETQK